MLMTLAVRLILMEIPTAFKAHCTLLRISPLPQLSGARKRFHKVHFLGLKDSHLKKNDHQVGDRYSSNYPCFIILSGPEFSGEYFSLIKRTCFFCRVPTLAVLPLSPATFRGQFYPFSHLKWENSGITSLNNVIAGDTQANLGPLKLNYYQNLV